MAKNESPIQEMSEIENLQRFNDFEFKEDFQKICTLTPEKNRERLIITDVKDKAFIIKKGFMYCFVLDGKLLKIGSSTSNIKGRVQSYNCGKQAYRDNGTCSTTNYFVLQSFLNLEEKIDLYAFFPESVDFDILGELHTVSAPAKLFEKKILTKLKEEDKMPPMCTQT